MHPDGDAQEEWVTGDSLTVQRYNPDVKCKPYRLKMADYGIEKIILEYWLKLSMEPTP
jgi:hypothetical protein